MTTLHLTGPTLHPASGGKPKQIVILLHGFGSNGADLISFAPGWRRALPDALFIAPNAPEHCVGSAGGFQWWGLQDLSPASLAAGAARAAPALDGFIDDQLKEHGLSEDRLALVGFSQGTMMALHTAPRRTKQIAAVVGYSGLLADTGALAREILTRPPILLVHGTADQVVPFQAMQLAKGQLHRLGIPVETHASPGLGHSVDPTGLQLGERFVAKAFGVA